MLKPMIAMIHEMIASEGMDLTQFDSFLVNLGPASIGYPHSMLDSQGS